MGTATPTILKQHRNILYTNLLISGKLNSHLAEIDRQATDMCFRLVKELAEQESVTEALKACKSNGVGWSYEQHPKSCRGGCV